MFYQLIYLNIALVCVFAAPPTDVVPLEKQQPTVIPIVAQSEELQANGTLTFSYETANGIKREETSYDKVLPRVKSDGSVAEGGDKNDNSNEIHVQQGSYSYTAPDGTVITVRYIADENGFRPIGDHLPKPPSILVNASAGRISGRTAKTADNTEGGSAPVAAIAEAPEKQAPKPTSTKALEKPNISKVETRIAESSSAEQSPIPTTEGQELLTTSDASSNTKTSPDTEISSTTEGLSTTVVPSTTEVSSTSEVPSTEVSSTTDFASTTEVSLTTEVSSTTEVPSTTKVPSTTEVPSTAEISSSSEIPSVTEISSTTIVPSTRAVSITTEEGTSTTLTESTTSEQPSSSEVISTEQPTTSEAASTSDTSTTPEELASTSTASTPDDLAAGSTLSSEATTVAESTVIA